MLIKKVHHIGIAVKDIDKAAKFYVDNLGLRRGKTLELKEFQVKIAFIPIGETTIELLEATDPTGTIAKHISEKGEGLHHICLEVDDIEGALKALKEKGIRLMDEKPRRGAEGKIAFINPESVHGVLLELIEREG
jgi:methylmalonyl-CoA/ethylmalonyl-CoA epimerase